MNQRIRLKIGDNEIELEGNDEFIKQHLKSFVEKYAHVKPEVLKTGAANLPAKVTVVSDSGKKALAPAEYVRQKNPRGGTEELIVLAKYLEDNETLSEFTVKDINRVAKAAKIGKVDNSYYPLAVKQGLLNRIKHGRYQLTLTGEDAVLNMANSK